MKIFSVVFGVLSASIISVQGYRSAQTQDDLLLRDLVDELDIRYPNTDIDRTLSPLSTRDFLDARTLRYLDGVLTDAHLRRRRLLENGDYLSAREALVDPPKSESAPASPQLVPRVNGIELKIKIKHPESPVNTCTVTVAQGASMGAVKKELRDAGCAKGVPTLYRSGEMLKESDLVVPADRSRLQAAYPPMVRLDIDIIARHKTFVMPGATIEDVRAELALAGFSAPLPIYREGGKVELNLDDTVTAKDTLLLAYHPPYLKSPVRS